MRYLNGFWLEEYVWLVAQDSSLDDVQVGVKVEWQFPQPSTAPHNEFDMLAVYRNRLLVVECKTSFSSNIKQDIITKLDSLGRNAGGLFGHTLLCSAQSLDDAVKNRALAQKVAVIDGNKLPSLRQTIMAWKGSRLDK
jgi:hypothetical protein